MPAKKETRADRVIRFIESFCRVPQGDVGRPVKLRVWQKHIIRETYDGRPAPRRVIISLGRKNGKTALASFLLLAHVAGPEARPNGQVYSAAQSRDQAAQVFNFAAQIVRMSPDLTAIVRVRDSAKSLFCTLNGVTYRALSAEHSTAYGLGPCFLIHDELGQVRGPSSPLYTALETAMGAQVDPLSIIISTQAATDADLLSTLIDRAKTGADKRLKLIIYEAPKDAEIDDESAWKAANPALGDFLNLDEFRILADDAEHLPAFESAFRNLHLNQRVALTSAFLSADVWKLGGGEPDLSAFADYPSWWGLDLAKTLDLAALIGICRTPDGLIHVAANFWTPLDGLKERDDRDRAPYVEWRKQGLLTATPGRTIDYAFIAHRLTEVSRQCGRLIEAIAFDDWEMPALKRELEAAGAPELPFLNWRQGYKTMSPSLSAFEKEALNGKLRHGGHPILTWNVANAVVTMDPAGNRKLDKSKATGRIDGAQSLAMAMGAMALGAVGEAPPPPSPWDSGEYRLDWA